VGQDEVIVWECEIAAEQHREPATLNGKYQVGMVVVTGLGWEVGHGDCSAGRCLLQESAC
jgi:hypothetical protein